MRSLPALSLLLFLGAHAPAQSVVVPNANENARGTSGLNTLTRDAGNPRTYMLGFSASELSGIPPGSVITGVSFRSYVGTANPATWPPADATWTPYEVTIGNAIPIDTWTGTFMNNFTGTPVPVRTGPMVMEAGTYTNNTALPSPQPNAWGEMYWDFKQTFTYTGGHLGILFTHPGSDANTAFFLDIVPSSPTTHGRAMSASTFQAVSTTTTAVNFTITRIHYGYGAGCPGTGGETPMLVQSKNVTGGGDVVFSIANAPASAVGIYSLGVLQTSIPLPGGCTLLTSPIVTVPVVLSTLGRHRLTLSAPAGIAGTIYVQGFAIDPGAPAGFTATNGTTVTISP